MGDHDLTPRDALSRRRTYLVGGSLLISSVLINVALSSVAGWFFIPWLGPAVFSAALIVFAIGFTRSGSIVPRRPAGVFGLVGLAVWTLGLAVFGVLLYPMLDSPDAARAFVLTDGIARFLLAGIAVVEIARAETAPHPWRWAPAWLLCGAVVTWLVTQFGASIRDAGAYFVLMISSALSPLLQVGGTLALGMLAILIGTLRRDRTVAIDLPK